MNSKKNNLLQRKELQKSSFKFTQKKETTISSLFEVEKFLCNFKDIWKYLKLYKILK